MPRRVNRHRNQRLQTLSIRDSFQPRGGTGPDTGGTPVPHLIVHRLAVAQRKLQRLVGKHRFSRWMHDMQYPANWPTGQLAIAD